MTDHGRMMRCDLHVHSRHSGPATLPVLRHLARECYSGPDEVYLAERRRGMDLVTLTDHDTIAGALELAGRADTFLSEEVTCLLPGGREVHLGVFDITEADHEGLQSRRRDLEAFFACAAERQIPVCVNHPFSALTGAREEADLPRAFAGATHVEARNGMMSVGSNARARAAARHAGLAACGGSDAHTLGSVAAAYTCVPARDRAEFLSGLRAGLTIPAGRSGTYARLTADVARLALAACLDQGRRAAAGGTSERLRLAALLALLPLVPLLPLVTALTYAGEQLFARRHFRRYERNLRGASRPRPPLLGAAARGTSLP